MFPLSVSRYLAARTFPGPWHIEGTDRRDFAGAVVIPALAEGDSLFATLESLAANPPELLDRFLILVVVNHREDAEDADKEDNLDLLRRLAGSEVPSGLRLARVDAASPGRELPIKMGGVGLARKIGLDLALRRLDFAGTPPVLVSLDADTLVESNYLEAILDHFRSAREGGAILPFRHRSGATPFEEAAILRYELFLRHYVLGLSIAGSPYAFHTVGSAMACRAEAYVKAGGMNRRVAGEDFYFLQQLARTSGVARLGGTVVHPSPRSSRRVPFGTGRAVGRLLEEGSRAVLFYPPEAFTLLKGWLSLSMLGLEEEGNTLLERARRLSTELAAYLESIDFPAVWNLLRLQHRSRESLVNAFHGWFDALRTLRLIHHLCEGAHGRVEPDLSLPFLLTLAGEQPEADSVRQLELLRTLQG